MKLNVWKTHLKSWYNSTYTFLMKLAWIYRLSSSTKYSRTELNASSINGISTVLSVLNTLLKVSIFIWKEYKMFTKELSIITFLLYVISMFCLFGLTILNYLYCLKSLVNYFRFDFVVIFSKTFTSSKEWPIWFLCCTESFAVM